MRYLLDTHTLLWFLGGDGELSENARDLIEDSESEIFVSIASLWEIAIKLQVGKLRLLAPFDSLFPKQLQDNSIEILSLELSHLSQMLSLHLHHRDPFDRIILSQAIVERLPIIGKDQAFESYEVETVW